VTNSVSIRSLRLVMDLMELNKFNWIELKRGDKESGDTITVDMQTLLKTILIVSLRCLYFTNGVFFQVSNFLSWYYSPQLPVNRDFWIIGHLTKEYCCNSYKRINYYVVVLRIVIYGFWIDELYWCFNGMYVWYVVT